MTKSQLRYAMGGIVALFILCSVYILPAYANKGINWVNNKTNLGLPTVPQSGFNLGLDLQGGAHLVYQANIENILGKDQVDAVEGVRDVIERRVRGGLGVAEPLVQTTKVGSDYRIIVELPGVTDVNQAIKMIGETPVLEFKEENNEPPRDLTADEKKQMDEYNKLADKKAKEALLAVARGMDFTEGVKKYSEDTQSINNGGDMGFISEAINPEAYTWAKTHKVGEISKDLIKSASGYNILKKISEKDGDKTVTASHLLICYMGAKGCENVTLTKSEALTKIQELKKQATPQNFSDLVKKNSTEPNAATSGGELGTFGKGQMVEAFEKVVFDMPVNAISEPVETEFGYHLIYKKAETTPKLYNLAHIYVKIKAKTDILPPTDQWKSSGLSGKQLDRAEVSSNQSTGQVEVSLKFNDEGTKLFSDITTRNVGKTVAIFLDGTPISIPKVNEPISGGSAVISGGFTLTEAKLLSQRLNSGALPVPVELISQKTIAASLGADSLTKSFKAGIIGLLLVICFMILYYRLPGLLSVFALLLYAVLSLSIFKLIGATLTLSGIAGLILSIGMAVDANVLVFERLKEELRSGKSIRPAMEEAFVRAWSSIRDSNVTTLISCVCLIWIGTGFVQGFAVTLAIGVLVSMFTAVTVTRTIMRLVLPLFGDKANILFLGHTKIVIPAPFFNGVNSAGISSEISKDPGFRRDDK